MKTFFWSFVALSLCATACNSGEFEGSRNTAAPAPETTAPTESKADADVKVDTPVVAEEVIKKGTITLEIFKSEDVARKKDVVILAPHWMPPAQLAKLSALMGELKKKLDVPGSDVRFLYAGPMPIANPDLAAKFEPVPTLVTQILLSGNDDLAAITKELLTEDGQARLRVRPGAQLEAIIVSGEDRRPVFTGAVDADGLPVSSLAEVKLPAGSRVHGIIPLEAQSADPECQSGIASAYNAQVVSTKGFSFNFCRSDWEVAGSVIAQSMHNQGKLFGLKEPPDVKKPVVVTINDQPLDPSQYSIDELYWILRLNQVPNAGDAIKVTYSPR